MPAANNKRKRSYPKKPRFQKKSSRQYGIATAPQKSLRDGTSIVCGNYFEIEAHIGSLQRSVGGSIRLDPTTFIVTPFGDCKVSNGVGITAGVGVPTTLEFQRLAIMRQLYSQFRVSSITVKVTADLNEIQNVICMCANRAHPTPVANLGLMKAQAHKELVPDAAHRQMTYTHKFSGDEAEFHMFKDVINPNNTTYIRVLQEVEPSGSVDAVATNKPVKLRCDVIVSMMAKDSTSATPALLATANNLVKPNSARLDTSQQTN